VHIKREYPDWGAHKIRERLLKQLPDLRRQHRPCGAPPSTWWRRRRRRYKASGTTPSTPSEPNALWCADYKGEFRLGNRRYCYTLTITDFATRYLITCEALSGTQDKYAFTVFERAFKGLWIAAGDPQLRSAGLTDEYWLGARLRARSVRVRASLISRGSLGATGPRGLGTR
jgi:hypothetical protein